MQLISIREVLTSPENNPSEWFYLPPNKAAWNLDTQGIFSLNSSDFPPDSDDYLPKQAKEDGWLETLNGADIEDVVENVKEQLAQADISVLFEAFIFYYENDAFIEF